MTICIHCTRHVFRPCVAANDNAPPAPRATPHGIVVACDRTLLRRVHFRRMAVATAALLAQTALSRRGFANWLTDVIFEYEGAIVCPDGRPFAVTDTLVDDAFNNDGSFRWLSDFIRFADKEPRQSPQRGILARLRVIDLAFRIAYPDIARHFMR